MPIELYDKWRGLALGVKMLKYGLKMFYSEWFQRYGTLPMDRDETAKDMVTIIKSIKENHYLDKATHFI